MRYHFSTFYEEGKWCAQVIDLLDEEAVIRFRRFGNKHEAERALAEWKKNLG